MFRSVTVLVLLLLPANGSAQTPPEPETGARQVECDPADLLCERPALPLPDSGGAGQMMMQRAAPSRPSGGVRQFDVPRSRIMGIE